MKKTKKATKVNGLWKRNQFHGAQPCARMMPCMLSVPVSRTRREDREPGRDLVADDLRRRADAAEQRPLVVRRPAGHQDADDHQSTVTAVM